MNLQNNTILITGGAAGIGLALAKALIAKDNTVIVCDINEQKLKEIAPGLPQVKTYVCDVARSDERKRLFSAVTEAYPELNMLINNAAILNKIDYTKDIPLYDLEREVLTNFMAPLVLSSMFLPEFIKKSNTAIINISSPTAVRPQYTNPLYSSTKAGLTVFSEALRKKMNNTLKNGACSIVEVFPPVVDTYMTQSQNVKKVSPANVAQKIIAGLEKDKKQIWISGKDVQFVFLASRILISLMRLPRKIVKNINNLCAGRGLSW